MQKTLLMDDVDQKIENNINRPMISAIMKKNNFTPTKIGKFPINTVQQLDCINAMKQLPSNCVDLAIADPPYNLSKGGNWKWDNSIKMPGFGGNWSKVMAAWDNMPLGEYLIFTLEWLSEIKRIVRPTGSIWIHGTYHNIGIINFALQLLEIEMINEVIWYKRNSFPNLSGRRLTASHETIIWAHTGKNREYFFNYEYSKNSSYPEDLLKMPGKQMRTVWDIPNNKEKDELSFGKHPTQKPVRLLKRMINLSSKPGDICLIPFAGSGSDCVAALQSNLHFLAFEIDPVYVDIANKRIEAVGCKYQKEKNSEKVSVSQNLYNVQVHVTMSNPKIKTIPSLIKWSGGKRSQALKIASYIPEHNRYFEPFLGGGALLFLTARPNSVAGDIFQPLISLWRLVQSDPDLVINNYTEQWETLQNTGYKYFYEVRERFNLEMNPLDLNFISRTCVNGIIRFNNEGKFNNSFHVSRKGMTPETYRKNVIQWNKRIQGVKFVCQDYLKTITEAKARDFVYFDPPYACSNNRYTEDLDQNRFFNALECLNQKGVMWALSFDGHRGSTDYQQEIRETLYKRRLSLNSGNSAVKKVLHGPIEHVEESLYLNY